ncbi:MAG: hypothetical protein ACRBN8_18480 [Nannocystales bacterium]
MSAPESHETAAETAPGDYDAEMLLSAVEKMESATEALAVIRGGAQPGLRDLETAAVLLADASTLLEFVYGRLQPEA